MAQYQEPKNSTHYVAELNVTKVERVVDPNVAQGQRARVLDEVTKIIVKAPTLEQLTSKLTQHIGLISDGEVEG